MLTLLFLSCALLPQETEYTIEPKIESVTSEKGRPILRVTGSTTLPDKAILKIYLHYGDVKPGRYLRYRSIQVKDGTFSHDFDIYLTKNMPGHYFAPVLYSPYHQHPDMPQKEITVTGKLTIGTNEEIKAADLEQRQNLVSEVRRLVDITGEVKKAVDDQIQKRDKVLWKQLTDNWRKEVVTIGKRNRKVPEYRALNLENIAHDPLESLIHLVQGMMFLSHKALEADPLDEKLLNRATTLRTEQIPKMARQISKLLGLTVAGKEIKPASPEELRAQINEICAHLKSAVDLMAHVKGEPEGSDRSGDLVQQFKNTYRKKLLTLYKNPPLPVREHIRALSDAARSIGDALEDAIRKPADTPTALQKSIQDLAPVKEEFLKTLDEIEKKQEN